MPEISMHHSGAWPTPDLLNLGILGLFCTLSSYNSLAQHAPHWGTASLLTWSERLSVLQRLLYLLRSLSFYGSNLGKTWVTCSFQASPTPSDLLASPYVCKHLLLWCAVKLYPYWGFELVTAIGVAASVETPSKTVLVLIFISAACPGFNQEWASLLQISFWPVYSVGLYWGSYAADLPLEAVMGQIPIADQDSV